MKGKLKIELKFKFGVCLNHPEKALLKTAKCKSVHFFPIFLVTIGVLNNDISKKDSPSFCHRTGAQCRALWPLSIFKFTLVDKSSQHCLTAVHCVGHQFLSLYTYTHVVSFPDQRLRSLVWEWNYSAHAKSWVDQHTAGTVCSPSSGQGFCHAHHLGSLVPRPCPAFRCFQYGKAGEGLE